MVRSTPTGVDEDTYEMVGYELMFHPRCERVASRTAGYDCVNNATVPVKNRPYEKGDDSDPGLASRRGCVLTATKRYSLTSVDCINAKRGGGPKTLERAVNITIPSLNDDITHATDVLIVGKPLPVSLSVDLVVVCCLPSVAPSADSSLRTQAVNRKKGWNLQGQDP